MKSDKCTPTVKFVKLNAYDKDMIPLIVLYSQARLCPTNLSRLAMPLIVATNLAKNCMLINTQDFKNINIVITTLYYILKNMIYTMQKILNS